MFNDETWQSHASYRASFAHMKARFSSDDRRNLWGPYEDARERLLALGLDPVGEYMAGLYPPIGRPAKNQAQILRSLVLFALLINKTPAGSSLTRFVNEVLPQSPALIALAGCRSARDLPPIGSFFDFMDRLWRGGRDRYRLSALLPAGKNGKKPKKDIGDDQKLVDPDPGQFSTQKIVEGILGGAEVSGGAQAALQDLLYLAAVLPSRKKGLIPEGALTVSGDGTAVDSHADPRGRHQKGCSDGGSCPFHKDCPRHYSDPDAEWGWDSHEKRWYFGFSLYTICCHNAAAKVDLPLLLSLSSARRHDSVNFLWAFDDYGRHLPGIDPENVCLDSAHDNLPTYRLLTHWGMNPLIDLNMRGSSSPDGVPDDMSFDREGRLLCMAGFPMARWGSKAGGRGQSQKKFRCPLKCGRVASCPCEASCKGSGRYGRTVYIYEDASLRFQTPLPRDSNEYKGIYKDRTSCERMNNRFLNDYHLKTMKIRRIDHFSFWSLIIGICIHLDAWAKTGLL